MEIVAADPLSGERPRWVSGCLVGYEGDIPRIRKGAEAAMSTSNCSPPNQTQDEDHDEDQAPDIEPEIGEGGPRDRARAFMEQRLAVLRPREAPPGEPVTVGPPDQPPAEDEEGQEVKGESPLPPDFRQRLMAEYRQRQRSALAPDAPAEPGEAPPEGERREGTNDA